MVRFLLLLSLLTVAAGTGYAAGTMYDLGQVQGLFARPGASTEVDVLSRFQQYAITTRHNERAGSLQYYRGPFGQTQLSIHDARNRYTGEADSFGQKYVIRDTRGVTLGWFDTFGSMPGEVVIQDANGAPIGRLRELVPGSPILKIRGDERCVALFKSVGIELTPATVPDKREAVRLARFDRLHGPIAR